MFFNKFYIKTEAKEGVLLHGVVLSLTNDTRIGDLKLALIYDVLRLEIADLAEISFQNINITSKQ